MVGKTGGFDPHGSDIIGRHADISKSLTEYRFDHSTKCRLDGSEKNYKNPLHLTYKKILAAEPFYGN